MNQKESNNLEKNLRKIVKQEIQPIKNELGRFTTKDDLNDFRDKAFETFATKEDVKEMGKTIIKRTRLDRDKILTDNDRVVGKTTKIEQAADTIGNIRRDERLDNLEGNVKQVKSKLGMAASAV